MAVNEGLRLTTQAIVVNTQPDVCWTPLGPLMVPVPYQISESLADSILVSPTVFMTGMAVFNTDSRISRVTGDERGTGGGVLSGVNCGHCRPITFSETVRVTGQHVVGHSAEFLMNCAGPDGPANTVGRAVYLSSLDIAAMARNNEALAENFPYSEATFAKIAAMRDEILKFSAEQGYASSRLRIASRARPVYSTGGCSPSAIRRKMLAASRC